MVEGPGRKSRNVAVANARPSGHPAVRPSAQSTDSSAVSFRTNVVFGVEMWKLETNVGCAG